MTYEKTRRSLHGLAELVLAGPQYRASGTIRLRVIDGGFATVAAPDLQVRDGALYADGARITLDDRALADIATDAGVAIGAPEGLYKDGSGAAPGDPVVLAGAAGIIGAFTAGARALEAFQPGETPVLWPEHFDLGVTLGEVNYGVSAGDAAIDEPYAYVGPWTPRVGDFWNVSFGAAHPLRELPDLEAFFRQGREEASRTA